MSTFRPAKPRILSAAIISACLAPQVLAQESASVIPPEAMLEEVFVTAQKRVESYLDVPVSVGTLSGEVLDLAKVNEFQDLVQVSPSLTFSQTGDQRGVGILMRGIGTTAFQTAVEPTVSTVVDGITMGRTVQFVSDLDDIKRVEVMRGPQGTLFGKNASGGLIAIHTNDPTDEFQGKVRATVADDDGYSLSAVLSGGLTNNVRGRLALYSKSFDGWAQNALYNRDINGEESFGARAKIAIDLSDRASLMLTGDYSEQDRDCCSSIIRGIGGAPTGGLLLRDYGAFGITLDEDNRKDLDAQIGFSNTETWGVSAEYNLDFDNWRFISITGYRGFTLESNQGVDGRPFEGAEARADLGLFFDSNGAYGGADFADAPTPGGDQEQKQFSQEFRLESDGWDNMNVTLGLFYWDQTVDRYFERVLNVGQVPIPFFGWIDSSVDTTSYAAFGHVDYMLNDQWTVTAGLRYTDDDIGVDYDKVTPSPGPAVGPSSSGASDTTETDLSGRLGLKFTPNDDWMFFATATTGYKSPAFDVIFNLTPDRIADPVPEETVTSYELGTKAEFWGRRARLGMTLFHSTFDDLQGQGITDDGLGFELISAGKAVTKGVEIDLTLKPTANWLINMGYAYTDATYDEYPGAQCYPGQTPAQGCVGGVQDLSGKQIANAPKNKFTMQTRYDFATGGSFNPYVGGSYRYQSDSPSTLNGDPRALRESYDVLDFIAGVEAADGTWQVELFVKNALDDFYIDRPGYFSLTDALTMFLTRDAQRYAGIELNYRFGAL